MAGPEFRIKQIWDLIKVTGWTVQEIRATPAGLIPWFFQIENIYARVADVAKPGSVPWDAPFDPDE